MESSYKIKNMKKFVLLCIVFLSLGASAQTYKIRKTYSATYNRVTDAYSYESSSLPDGMYITFITKNHFKINDKAKSEYHTQQMLSEDKDVSCTNFLAVDEKDETMGVKVCNVDGVKSITVLYPDKYYIIYYLED